MTDDTRARIDLIPKSTDGAVLRSIAEVTLQRLRALAVEGVCGAGRHERTAGRTHDRHGYRPRPLETRLGPRALRSPKRRQGSYVPGFLEPRQTAEEALTAVLQDAWIQGVSTRKVADLGQALGMTGIAKSPVWSLCQESDDRVQAVLERPLAEEGPSLWREATSLKVRQGGRLVSSAAISASAVKADGRREVSGLGRGAVRSGDVLERVPARPGAPRSEGGQAGDLGGPGRPEGGARSGAE